mmetsp:Transcript_85816/g.229603  ORF Transcript_85816/g.229603 Transcript_85816/m.229603 type:complete len:240 (-) Transcript_85816:310-1029(-)
MPISSVISMVRSMGLTHLSRNHHRPQASGSSSSPPPTLRVLTFTVNNSVTACTAASDDNLTLAIDARSPAIRESSSCRPSTLMVHRMRISDQLSGMPRFLLLSERVMASISNRRASVDLASTSCMTSLAKSQARPGSAWSTITWLASGTQAMLALFSMPGLRPASSTLTLSCIVESCKDTPCSHGCIAISATVGVRLGENTLLNKFTAEAGWASSWKKTLSVNPCSCKAERSSGRFSPR